MYHFVTWIKTLQMGDETTWVYPGMGASSSATVSLIVTCGMSESGQGARYTICAECLLSRA